jgi:hypothetical protein
VADGTDSTGRDVKKSAGQVIRQDLEQPSRGKEMKKASKPASLSERREDIDHVFSDFLDCVATFLHEYRRQTQRSHHRPDLRKVAAR